MHDENRLMHDRQGIARCGDSGELTVETGGTTAWRKTIPVLHWFLFQGGIHDESTSMYDRQWVARCGGSEGRARCEDSKHYGSRGSCLPPARPESEGPDENVSRYTYDRQRRYIMIAGWHPPVHSLLFRWTGCVFRRRQSHEPEQIWVAACLGSCCQPRT